MAPSAVEMMWNSMGVYGGTEGVMVMRSPTFQPNCPAVPEPTTIAWRSRFQASFSAWVKLYSGKVARKVSASAAMVESGRGSRSTLPPSQRSEHTATMSLRCGSSDSILARCPAGRGLMIELFWVTASRNCLAELSRKRSTPSTTDMLST